MGLTAMNFGDERFKSLLIFDKFISSVVLYSKVNPIDHRNVPFISDQKIRPIRKKLTSPRQLAKRSIGPVEGRTSGRHFGRRYTFPRTHTHTPNTHNIFPTNSSR